MGFNSGFKGLTELHSKIVLLKLEIISVDMGWSFLVFFTMLSVFHAMSVDCLLNVDFEIMLKNVFETKSWFCPSVILEEMRKNKKCQGI